VSVIRILNWIRDGLGWSGGCQLSLPAHKQGQDGSPMNIDNCLSVGSTISKKSSKQWRSTTMNATVCQLATYCFSFHWFSFRLDGLVYPGCGGRQLPWLRMNPNVC
jgi:hypothetical protein